MLATALRVSTTTTVFRVRITHIRHSDRVNRDEWIAAMYPPDAIAVGVEGVVIVEFLVEADGNVGRARVVHSSPLLDQAAIAPARCWHYTCPWLALASCCSIPRQSPCDSCCADRRRVRELAAAQ